jgi:crotonobetainyl-CoA:carnitine CoA-transferase CaiB-like acyl-CoA transferase
MSRTICEGLQVIEMGAGSIGASMAGMLLADNGARVLKVEPPEGDRLRGEHPAGFLVWNRGKESLVADLRTDEGRAAGRDAALHADVVLAGVPAGKLEQWGFGEHDLREANPGLVHCQITGFGPSGDYAGLKAYEGVVAAKVGVFARGNFGFRSGPIFYHAPWGSIGARHIAFPAAYPRAHRARRPGRASTSRPPCCRASTARLFGTMTWRHSAHDGIAHGTSAVSDGCEPLGFFVPAGRSLVIFADAPIRPRRSAGRSAWNTPSTTPDSRNSAVQHGRGRSVGGTCSGKLWKHNRTSTGRRSSSRRTSRSSRRFSEEGLDHQQIRHNGETITVQDTVRGAIEQVGPVAAFAATPSRIDRSAPALDDHGDDFSELPARSPSTAPAPAHALDGVTIVELGYFYAMPYGVTMAGALGARVIKLEGTAGDPMRSAFGAPDVGGAKTMEGKESLAVDLQTAEGRTIVQEVAARGDMFVNGFRSGVAERMGLDYATLSKLNPRLVYVHAAGYGVDGPLAHRPIYAGGAGGRQGIGRYGGRWLDPGSRRLELDRGSDRGATRLRHCRR